MDSFESAVIELLVRGGRLEAEILRQLPMAIVLSRTHDRDRRETRFGLPAEAPIVIPRDVGVAGDVDVEGVGSVYVDLEIEDGWLYSLVVDCPAEQWPADPRIIGLTPYPEP
jgi:hypothetical protein